MRRRSGTPFSVRRPVTAVEIALALAVAAVGATLQGTVGFGLGLVAAPLLALIRPAYIPGPLLVCGLVLSLLLWRRERHATDLRGLGWALTGRLPGVILGAWAVAAVGTRVLGLGLGGLVLVGVAMSAAGPRFERTPATLVGAGLVSGFMGTATSIGGPPMALIYQHAAGEQIRSTLAVYFTVGVSLSLAALWWVGRFGAVEARLALTLVPGVLLGYALSRHGVRWLQQGFVRPAVLGTSALAAAALILRHALG